MRTRDQCGRRRPRRAGLGGLGAIGLVVGLLALAWPSVASAGPWVPEPGEGYLKVSGSYFDATGMYDRSGEQVDTDYSYRHAGARLYGDIGLAPHLGLSASLPWRRSQNVHRESSAQYIKSGLGDLDLALQGGTTIGQFALSGVGKLRVPLYSETISTDSPSPIALTAGELERERYIPALGDGSVDMTFLMQAGLSLHPFPGWLTASVGPKLRFQGFGNGLEYAASAGAYLIPERLALSARVSGVERFSGGNERPTKRFMAVSGGPIVRIAGGFALEATGTYLPTGAFVSRGWSASLGLSYDGRLFPNPWGGGKPGTR